MEPETAVSIENVTKVFRLPSMRKRTVVAVRDVSLRVAAGEIFGLIGPNGSGKSTTMKILLGLISPTRGRTAIFGRDSSRVDSRAEVGFLPENPYFYRHLTAAETLRFYGRLCGLGKSRLARRTEELLAMVDLEEARNRRLSGFSKGMLQRIGLAQALIHDPRLVVLDEPTAGVDPVGSRRIRDLVLELKGRGITVVLCSHLLEQVQEVCDRVGILARGRLVREGSLDTLIAIENQTEIILENASPELLRRIRQTVTADQKKADGPGRPAIVKMGRPRTTLERLFLEATQTTGHKTPAATPEEDGKDL